MTGVADLPGKVPRALRRALSRREGAQGEALVALVLGKGEHGEWERPAEWLATVLSVGGDPISATTIKTYRRHIELMKELTRD